jgi:Domain of unknown function (DUF4268)
MKSFPEFESVFLGALQQERSDLQDLQGASEAQLSAWIEHLFQVYLGYSYKDFSRGEGMHIGAKGGKQLFPDLRIDILDNGLIFIECKRQGRLDGPKGKEERDDAVSQLMSYIRAHLDRASTKPKTVLGVVTDGNRWLLMGLNRINEFHIIAEWAFLTDDPRLIAQRLWLLAKPALAQPTSPLVEFLARRTLAEVLKEMTKRITNKVNENLPDGSVSGELIGKWLRDAFSDPSSPPRLVPADSTTVAAPVAPQAPATGTEVGSDESDGSSTASDSVRHSLRLKFWGSLLNRPKAKTTRHANIKPGEYSWIGAGSGVRGVPFVYAIGQHEGRVELFIDRGADDGKEANKGIFDTLHGHKAEIEQAFGGELSWQPLEGKRSCRIAYKTTAGGYRSDEAKWPAIQDAMIDAMIRLEQALTPHLAKLKTELAS